MDGDAGDGGKGGGKGKGKGHSSSKWDGKDDAQLVAIAATFVRDCPHVMASLNDFEKKHCAAFARHEEGSEHKLEYTEVHKEYCAHVEKLLAMMVAHTGATEEDMERALKGASPEQLDAFGILLDRTDYAKFAAHMRQKHDWWQRQQSHPP
eukprot:TRINITY_DN57235_c0_g1_i1.p2 TRINITY_DN57235_c0_g1~~TRINITY_DN57235_c0_g1_i1.p2  ORF type:complete len:151 (+),score=43.46 TRINITY_DN57235_c0_g1_i1:90-542(+)